MIFYGKQFLDNEEVNAVKKVLKSEFITQGPKSREFEQNLKNRFKSKYCLALSSGTAALHLAGKALGWKKNDLVLTTPITFLATLNSIIYNNASPVLVDINKYTLNIDLNLLEDKIISLKKKNKKIKSVIGVDFSGSPCEWKEIKFLSKKYNFTTINDNCHAIGAKYLNDIGYAVKYADIVTHSYHPVKNITTGEGGALFTNNKNFYEKIKNLNSHGVIKGKNWNFKLTDIGFNYRLNEISSAIGISQLKKLNNFLKKRRIIAKNYDNFFKKFNNVKTPYKNKNFKSAYHLYTLSFDFKKNKINKSNFFNFMKKHGFSLQVHYVPLFFHKIYKNYLKFSLSKYTNSITYYDQSFSIPIYPSLKKSDQDKLKLLIKKYLHLKC